MNRPALLLTGAILLALSGPQAVSAVPAWLAPVALLAFARTSPTARGLAALALAQTLAIGAWFADGLFPVPWPVLAVLALGGGFLRTLPYVADLRLARRLPAAPGALVFPTAAVAVEFLATRWSPVGTWSSMAYTQSSLPLLQLASVTGIWGLSFLVHALAPAVLAWRRSRVPAVAFGAVLLATLGGGFLRLRQDAPGPEVPVAAITPSDRETVEAWGGLRPRGVARADGAGRDAAGARFRHLTDLLLHRSEAAAAAGARLVAWSEWVPVLAEDLAALEGRAGALARERRIHLALAVLVLERGERFPLARNLSLLFDERGTHRWSHAKSHPVLGMEDTLIAAGAKRIDTADTSLGRLGVAICQDLDFPWLLRQTSRERVDLLLAPADDWPAIRTVHARMARFRAIENGVPLLRAASNGRSFAADAYGRLRGEQETSDSAGASLLASIPVRLQATLYGHLGDWLAYLCLVGLAIAALGTRPRAPGP